MAYEVLFTIQNYTITDIDGNVISPAVGDVFKYTVETSGTPAVPAPGSYDVVGYGNIPTEYELESAPTEDATGENPPSVLWDGALPWQEPVTPPWNLTSPDFLWSACTSNDISGNEIVNVHLLKDGQELSITADSLSGVEIGCEPFAPPRLVTISNAAFTGYDTPVAACGDSCASNYDPDADSFDNSLCNYNNPQIYYPTGLCVEDDNVIDQINCTITYNGFSYATTISEPTSSTTTSKFLAFKTELWINLENANFTNGITYELTQGPGAPSNAYFATNNGTSYTTSDYTEVIEVVFTSSDDVYENENIKVEWSIGYTHCQPPTNGSELETGLPRTGDQWFIVVNDDIQVFGCTDVSAINYDSGATHDDDSCLYMTIEPNTTTPDSGESVTFTITGTGTQSGFFADVLQMGSFPGGYDGLQILVDYTDNTFTDDTISLPSASGYTQNLTSNNYILAQQYTAVFTITNGTISFEYEIGITPTNEAPVADILATQGGSSHPASTDVNNPTPVFGNEPMPDFWAGFTDPTGLAPYKYKWVLHNETLDATIEYNGSSSGFEEYPHNGFIPSDHSVFDSIFFYDDVIEVKLQVTDAGELSSNSSSRYFQIIEYITGCMDETACNFDNAATFDDGSCNYGPTVTFSGYIDDDADGFYETAYEVIGNSDGCIGDSGANDVALGTWDAGRRCYCDYDELEYESGISDLVNSATGPEVYGCLPGDTIGPSGDEQATNYNYNFDGETVTGHQNKYCISLDALYAFKSGTGYHLPNGYYDGTDVTSSGTTDYEPVSGDNIKIRIDLDEIWKNDTDWSEWGFFGDFTQLVIDYNYQDGNDVDDAQEIISLDNPAYDDVYDNSNHLQSSNGNITNGINYELAGTYTIRTYISQPGTIFYHKDFTFTIDNEAPTDVEIIDEYDVNYEESSSEYRLGYLEDSLIYLGGNFEDLSSDTHTLEWQITRDSVDITSNILGDLASTLSPGWINISDLGQPGTEINIFFTVTDTENESGYDAIYLFIGTEGCMTEPADSCDNYPTFSYCPIITNYDPNAIVDSNQCIYAFINGLPSMDLDVGQTGFIIIDDFDYDDDWVSPATPFYFNVIWGDGNEQAYELTDNGGLIIAQNTYESIINGELIIQIIDNNNEVYYELIRPLNVAEQEPEIVAIEQCSAGGDDPCDEGNSNFNSGAIMSDTHTFEVGEEIYLRFFVKDYSQDITVGVVGQGDVNGDGAFTNVEYAPTSPNQSGYLTHPYTHNPFTMPTETITITMTASDGVFSESDVVTLQPKIYGCLTQGAINYNCNTDNAPDSIESCDDGVTEDDGSCIFYPNVTLISTPGGGGSGIFSNDWEGFEVDVEIDYNLSDEAISAGYSYDVVNELVISSFKFTHDGSSIDFLAAPGVTLGDDISADITDNTWSIAATLEDFLYGIPVGPSVYLFSNFVYETFSYTDSDGNQLYEFPGVDEYLDPGDYEVEIEIITTDSNGISIQPTLYYLNITRPYYVCDDDDADNYFGLYDRDDDSQLDTNLCVESDACISHNQCSYIGCTDEEACNYDPTANINSGCTYPETGYGCDCANMDIESYYTDNDNDGYGCGDGDLAATQSCVDLTALDSGDCNGTGTAVTNKFYCETDPGTFYETAAACHVDTMCTADGSQCTDTGMLSNCWTLNNDGTDTGDNCNCASNVICDSGCCGSTGAECYVPTEFEPELYTDDSTDTICCESGELDDCGVCDGGNSEVDCAGVCNGNGFINICGYCIGNSPGGTYDNPTDTNGLPDSFNNNFGTDCAGVCDDDDGYGSTLDGGGSCCFPDEMDDCNICFGSNNCHGCTSSIAENYDVNATYDPLCTNGNCDYPPTGTEIGSCIFNPALILINGGIDLSISENNSLDIDFQATDYMNANPLGWVVTNNGNGTININGGNSHPSGDTVTIQYNAPDFDILNETNQSFSVKVIDSEDRESVIIQVNITITDIDENIYFTVEQNENGKLVGVEDTENENVFNFLGGGVVGIPYNIYNRTAISINLDEIVTDPEGETITYSITGDNGEITDCVDGYPTPNPTNGYEFVCRESNVLIFNGDYITNFLNGSCIEADGTVTPYSNSCSGTTVNPGESTSAGGVVSMSNPSRLDITATGSPNEITGYIEVVLIHSEAPEGSIVVSAFSSFGYIPDSYNIKALGGDDRKYVVRNITVAMGAACYSPGNMDESTSCMENYISSGSCDCVLYGSGV